LNHILSETPVWPWSSQILSLSVSVFDAHGHQENTVIAAEVASTRHFGSRLTHTSKKQIHDCGFFLKPTKTSQQWKNWNCNSTNIYS